MSAASQNQSCLACAQSKRKCNRQRPTCQRCSERAEECIYQSRKKHRRRRRTLIDQSTAEQSDAGSVSIVGSSSAWLPMSTTTDVELDLTMVGWSLPASPTIDYGLATRPFITDTVNHSTEPSRQSLWFLQDDSWTLYQSDDLASCQATIDLEAIFDIVRSMLVHWTETGSNGFIHSKLYEYGMPTYLQDAFVILSSYTAATAATRQTVLQIADERAQDLVQQRMATVEEGLGEVKAHLSRLHALFVLIFIRLFDGSVRFRASAERQLPVLRTRMTETMVVAARYRGDHIWNDHIHGATEIWHSWFVIESVRRTLLVVQSVANVYHCMTVGHATCDGSVMITARCGMFEAETSAKWLDLCSKIEEPLLVPPLRPRSWMLEHSSADVDEFVLKYWSYIVEPDRLKCWVDRGRCEDTNNM